MSIEQMLEAMAAPPAPASEVVSVERATIENILTEIEEKHPLRLVASYLRRVLAEPKVELWAIHSVGPGEVYPCLDKEDAERQAQELRDTGAKLKAESVARGESVAMWSDWVADVIPSPWEPAEHFEIMAEEWQDNHRELAEYTTTLQAERDKLKTEGERLANNRDMWKGQVERQAEELTNLRAERDELLKALEIAARLAAERLSITEQHFIDDTITRARSEQL